MRNCHQNKRKPPPAHFCVGGGLFTKIGLQAHALPDRGRVYGDQSACSVKMKNI